MNSIWFEDYIVNSYEVDYTDTVRLNYIFNYMQETAIRHVENIGLGNQTLKEAGFFWVLSKAKIIMHNYPKSGEKIKISTWAKQIKRLFAMRDFEILNEDNERIGIATTAWLALKTETMRPHKIDDLPIKLPIHTGREGFEDSLDKLHYEGALMPAFEKQVTYSDIDVNKHVNNAKYVEWVLDCFPLENFGKSKIKSLQINFLNEARFTDKIVMFKGDHNKDNFIEGIQQENQNKIFQACITW